MPRLRTDTNECFMNVSCPHLIATGFETLTNVLTSLSLIFIICEVGLTIATSQGYVAFGARRQTYSALLNIWHIADAQYTEFFLSFAS